MGINPYSERILKKYVSRSSGRTSTRLYECRIIDVHPENLTCDVIVNQSSKTILGVNLSSSLFGKNLSEIIIPDVGSAAILASTSDNTDPFIVAYKQHYSDGKDGFTPNNILSGEKASILSKHSFEKNDKSGNFIKSNSSGDNIGTLKNKLSVSSKEVEVKAFNNVLTSTYESGKITNEDVLNIMNETINLKGLIGSESVFAALRSVHKMSSDNQQKLPLLKTVSGYIAGFLDIAKTAKFSFNDKTLLKENIPIDKEIYFSPVSIEEQDIFDEQGAKIGTRFIETDENDYTLMIDMLTSTPNTFLYKLYSPDSELIKTKAAYLDYEKDDIKYDVYSEDIKND